MQDDVMIKTIERIARNVPMSQSGERWDSYVAHRLCMQFRVPMDALRNDLVNTAEVRSLADANRVAGFIKEWKRNASPRDLALASIEADMHFSENMEGDLWAQSLADMMHEKYLLDRVAVRGIFHNTPGGNGRWTLRVAEAVTDYLEAQPRRAAFVMARTEDGQWAATTRAADRGERGIGLPGGKVDGGETLREAALREAAEEGWAVPDVQLIPAHVQMVNDFLCVWYDATGPATELAEFKEKGRITPVRASTEQLIASGMGNEHAFAAFREEDYRP